MFDGQGSQEVGAASKYLNQDSGSDQPMKAPRAWWWDFILHASTFGLYTMFWLVGRLREVRRLGQHEVKPWLWFFVPLFLIAQLIALPRLTRYLRELEQANRVPAWGASRYVWITGVILVSAFFNVQERIATPLWTFVFAMLVWGALFTILEARFNTLKRNLDNPPVGDAGRGYKWWEWLIAVPMVCVTFIALPYLSLGALGVYDIDELAGGEVYIDAEGRFQFPVPTEGWVRVSPGTFAQDEALLEVRGPAEDIWAIVYHYEGMSLEELAHNRRQTLYGSLRRAGCEEFRQFSGDSLNVSTQITCTGMDLNTPSMWTTGIVESEHGVYELIVHMTTPAATYQRRKPELLRMTEEFEVL